MKNPALKERREGEEPYMEWRAGDWTWYVMKSWQAANGKPGARWFCRVVTPMTGPSGDLGDTYVHDVVTNAELADWDHSIWPTDEDVHAFVNNPTPPQPIAGFGF